MSALGFGMTFPALLAIFPVALALLIYAYRRKQAREPVSVGTLLILRKIAGTPSAPRRFVPPPRFFFELLVLALLIAAATGIYLRLPAERLVIVIDNSLGMAAVDTSVSSRLTLLEQAKARAKDLLRGRLTTSEVAVYSVAASTKQLTEGFVGKAAAETAIEGIVPAREEDRLAREVERIIGDHPDSQIFAFSDRPFEVSGDRSRFTGVTLGRELENVAVSAASLERDASTGSLTVTATVVSFGSSAVEGKLAVESVGAEGSTLLATQTFALAPGQTDTVTISSLKLGVGEGIRARIDGPTPAENALSLDDETFAAAFDETSTVRFVSPAGKEALGLDRIRTMAFEHIAPEQYVSEPSAFSGPYIFHRFVPPELPAGSSLVVMPPPGNPVIPTAPEREGLVTRWDDSDLLLSYINIPLLELRAVRAFDPPHWMREVLATSAGPAILAGESSGRRLLAIGFELFPYEGAASPSSSILLLNALKWLESSSWSGTPGGASRDPGVYRTERGMVAVNFYSEAESNLLSRQPTVAHAPVVPGSEEGRRPLHTWLGYLCLALIFGDLLFSLVRAVLAGRATSRVTA